MRYLALRLAALLAHLARRLTEWARGPEQGNGRA